MTTTCSTSAPRPSEFLPTTARTLHFDLTARDRNLQGGGASTTQTAVTVAGTIPFTETDTAGSAAAGWTYAVKWNVAGTTAAPFNVANVKITYSADGGLTYPTVLAASTPNNGTATVTIPITLTTTGRINVEAIGRPFFDISHANLKVTGAAATRPSDTSVSPASGRAVGGETVTPHR